MVDNSKDTSDRSEILRMSVQIVAAYVGKNSVAANDIPEVINTVYKSLSVLDRDGSRVGTEPPKPAINVRHSVTPDYIVCLEDGKKLKMLKRHLRAVYDMTPEEYRVKWGLPADYPMVAPNYAAKRSEFAKRIGLGRKKGPGPQQAQRGAA